jgi:hypothetical protein
MNTEAPIKVRLVTGAALLGQLWRSGVRCASGWSDVCECQPRTKFCLSKVQWCKLKASTMEAWGFGQTVEQFGVVQAMDVGEFEATGLTIAVEINGLGTHKVGPRGSIGIRDLAKLVNDPAGAAKMFRIVGQIPGAVVVGVEEPKKEEA